MISYGPLAGGRYDDLGEDPLVTSTIPTVRAAFAGLIDYAGLFPPAALAMEPALAAYADARGGAHAPMLDRFIVPASRLAELSGAYRGETPIALSVIVDAPLDSPTWFEATRVRLAAARASLAADARLRLNALEVPLPALRTLRDTYDAAIGQFAALASAAGVRDIPGYLEPMRDARWRDALPATMTVLARHRFGAKVRCGGATAETFPSCEDLGAFIRIAVAAGVPFKATAGLHHPVRRVDTTTGFAMHGFLNVLAATLVARDDTQPMTVESALAEEDAHAFRFTDESFSWRDRHFDVGTVAAARMDGFVAYGSCSFEEPVADLSAMGLFDEATS